MINAAALNARGVPGAAAAVALRAAAYALFLARQAAAHEDIDASSSCCTRRDRDRRGPHYGDHAAGCTAGLCDERESALAKLYAQDLPVRLQIRQAHGSVAEMEYLSPDSSSLIETPYS